MSAPKKKKYELKFSDKWLRMNEFKPWLKKQSDSLALCFVCQRSLCCVEVEEFVCPDSIISVK